MKNRQKTQLYSLLLLFLCISSQLFCDKKANASEVIEVISLTEQVTFVSARPKSHTTTQWLILIYSEAFRRLGIDFKFVEVPVARASAYSNSGRVGGELSRIYNYSDYYNNMVRVEEPNYSDRFAVFSSQEHPLMTGWESLRNTGYRVEYRRGIARCKEKLSEVVPPTQLAVADSIHEGISKLFAKRFDVYIDVEGSVDEYLRSQKFQDIASGRTIYKVGVMEELTAHAFLHKRHKALVKPLSTVLRQMKEEGLFKLFGEQVKAYRE
ncbi:MAG: hypothetical protein ACPF9K_05535 [Neptuniibacter sp.]